MGHWPRAWLADRNDGAYTLFVVALPVHLCFLCCFAWWMKGVNASSILVILIIGCVFCRSSFEKSAWSKDHGVSKCFCGWQRNLASTTVCMHTRAACEPAFMFFAVVEFLLELVSFHLCLVLLHIRAHSIEDLQPRCEHV